MCKEWENAFDGDASPNKTSVVSNIFKVSWWFQDVALNMNVIKRADYAIKSNLNVKFGLLYTRIFNLASNPRTTINDQNHDQSHNQSIDRKLKQ